MDTKLKEIIGESFVVNALLEAGILVSKPLFDQSGADLIGLTSVGDTARICRIQCKFRQLKVRTSVIVESSYVAGAFVLFLYLKTPERRYLFCFLPKDIRRYFSKGTQGKKSVFRLTITQKTIVTLNGIAALKFNSVKINQLIDLIKGSSPYSELRQIVKDLVQTTKKIQKNRRERDELQEIIHNIEVLNVKTEMSKELLEMLQEYVQYRELHEGVQ
jgi:hypothetical protein